ncbi:MAG: S8/S53 family peptidase [Betaproteobacteria bacterium]|nr:S8/S53 family peptidase [Betaproteobacteria bacterium]
MAISGYLLNANAGQVRAFNLAVIDQAGIRFGLALQPTSSHRAYISIDLFKQIRAALGEDAFAKLQKKTRISIAAVIEEADAKSLIETRDPADLGERPDLEQPPRAAPGTGQMLDWHLIETRIFAAWQALGGADNIQWGDVAIGHIDTGFTTHPALGFTDSTPDSPWIDTARDRNFFERELNPPDGAPVFAAFDSALDPLGGFSGGHGTRTLSVLCGFDESAAAQDGGSYAGYYGTAPRAPVVPVRIEDTIWLQNALADALPAAIDYLVNEAGVSVISLSMGSPKFALGMHGIPGTLRDAIDDAYEKGVILCCAAGNNVPDEKVVFPARCPRTVAVGGSAPGMTPWAGSSHGIQVDISAPAFPIRRANTRRGTRMRVVADVRGN